MRYLHEELGYDHLILEGGLFSCGEAYDALVGGASAFEAARLCAFGKDPCETGLYPLFEYAHASLRCSGRSSSSTSFIGNQSERKVLRADGHSDTVPRSIAVFRIQADGRLAYQRKYDVAEGDVFWLGTVALPEPR